MKEPEPDYGSRQHAILRYVSEHPNCTKADVIRHMKGKSAVTTTHVMLKDFIREGKIIVYKKNLQTHLLNINRENEFIWINNALADIYDFIQRCEKIRNKLEVFTKKSLPQLRKKNAISKNIEFQYVLFLQKFIPPLDSMLNRLLTRSIYNVKPEKDAQSLNRTIMDLMVELHEMPLFLHTTRGLEERLNLRPQHSDRAIRLNIDKINFDIQDLKQAPSKQGLTLLPEYDKLARDFKESSENFMKEFTRTLRLYHDKNERDL